MGGLVEKPGTSISLHSRIEAGTAEGGAIQDHCLLDEVVLDSALPYPEYLNGKKEDDS